MNRGWLVMRLGYGQRLGCKSIKCTQIHRANFGHLTQSAAGFDTKFLPTEESIALISGIKRVGVYAASMPNDILWTFGKAAGQDPMEVSFLLNGETVLVSQPATRTLLDWLREDRSLTGTKEGCNDLNKSRFQESTSRKTRIEIYAKNYYILLYTYQDKLNYLI